MKQLRKFLSLTAGERRILVGVGIWLVSIRLGLLVLPFKTFLRLSMPSSERNHLGRDDGLPPERIAWAVQVVSRYLPGMRNCLVQGLAAQSMLARRNYPAHLRIGVTKDEKGQVKAHAWVEFGGKVIIGKAGASPYTPLPILEI